jgi:hypothetical protein
MRKIPLRLFSTKEAASLLNISVRYLQKCIKKGKLKADKNPKFKNRLVWMISFKNLLDFYRKNKERIKFRNRFEASGIGSDNCIFTIKRPYRDLIYSISKIREDNSIRNFRVRTRKDGRLLFYIEEPKGRTKFCKSITLTEDQVLPLYLAIENLLEGEQT